MVSLEAGEAEAGTTTMPSQSCTNRVQSPTKNSCVLRGSSSLSAQELRAHLAAVIRLENLGVLLGAGASIAIGGKTMDELWKEFSEESVKSREWLENQSFVATNGKVNLETLIDALEIARLEWRRLKWSEQLPELESARADIMRKVVDASVLRRDWWKNQSVIENESEDLATHRRLLHKLSAARQPGQPSPWVFTTNYDLAVEWAAETIGLKVINGFDGLHRRIFSPHNFDLEYRNTLARGEARFGTYGIHLAKLHGSLSWKLDQSETVVEHSTSYLWHDLSKFLGGDDSVKPHCIVYPSTGKYLRTIGFVSGELIRRFTEFLARPQTCLIVSGYSFSDMHLNRILASGLRNPTLQLVVYLPEVRFKSGMPDFNLCSEWFRKFAVLKSPQVTIVGDEPTAYFETLVGDLPDPAVVDEQSERIRDMIKKLQLPMSGSRR